MRRYDVGTLKDGWNTETNEEDGSVEEYYYVSNPALGLWAVSSRFDEDATVSSNTQDEEDGECSSSSGSGSGTNINSDN